MLMVRRPKPCRSGSEGWAPRATPLAAANWTVRSMVAESPAWKPQAMLALVTRSSRASSWPMVQAPKLSPMSQLRSMVLDMGSPCLLVGQDQLQVAEMGFATEQQSLGFYEGDRCEPQGLSGPELGRLGEIH